MVSKMISKAVKAWPRSMFVLDTVKVSDCYLGGLASHERSNQQEYDEQYIVV